MSGDMRLSNHAIRRLASRNIQPQEVAEALASPTSTYPSRDGRTVVLGVTATGRRLKVVTAGAVIVTVADRDDER